MRSRSERFYTGVLSVFSLDKQYPSSFCRKCGLPLPWATREDIVSHVENMLADDRELEEGERRLLVDQLDSLRHPPEDSDTWRRQFQALDKLKAITPKVWETVTPVLMPILTAELKRQLGLPG